MTKLIFTRNFTTYNIMCWWYNNFHWTKKFVTHRNIGPRRTIFLYCNLIISSHKYIARTYNRTHCLNSKNNSKTTRKCDDSNENNISHHRIRQRILIHLVISATYSNRFGLRNERLATVGGLSKVVSVFSIILCPLTNRIVSW